MPLDLPHRSASPAAGASDAIARSSPFAEKRGLLEFIGWAIALWLVFGTIDAIASVVFNQPSLMLAAIVAFCSAAGLGFAWRLARTARPEAAVLAACVVFIVTLLVTAALVPLAFGAAAIAPFIIVAVALPYLRGTTMRVVLYLAWGAGVAVAYAGRRIALGHGVPDWFAVALHLTSVGAVLGLGFALFGQFVHRLHQSLAASLAANDAIRQLSATLEQRVNERTEALQESNARLAAGLHGLELRSREISLLSRLSELLQSCMASSEAYELVGNFAPQLFPEQPGALYMLSASRNLVESVATWGPWHQESPVFGPDQCWALRRGQMHVLGAGYPGLKCLHSDAPESLCIPLIGQNETLGVLHLRSYAGGNTHFDLDHQQLARTIGDAIALALANLRLRESLRQQSIRDPLTGLFNRRYMEETLERELRRAMRAQRPVGIVALDVDHFKQFNDQFGHDAGDMLLRELGLLLLAETRASDIACRQGGEEFLLVLPDAGQEATAKRAETIRTAVKQMQLHYGGEPLGPITISAGVAAFPQQGESAAALLKAADAALYEAKHAGRDRVMLAG
jgi:diguanylate cyclase (GGDEF)-like protein